MTRDDKVAQVRAWFTTAPHVQEMIAKAMRRNGVATIAELAEKHPKQFNSIHAAIETMEEEMPEPDFPWPEMGT